MHITFDGAEIDNATEMQVFGAWLKFVDGEGATVKIPPHVIMDLFKFAVNNYDKFENDAWNSGAEEE